jgi:uncharacterized protein YecE (DUF72 family)
MHELLIGTRDWQNTPWENKFYPDNLPEDWRFCFYSNQFRTVLVPGTVWDTITGDDINMWVEDSDKDFKLVCELPSVFSETLSITDISKMLLEFQDKTSLLGSQIVSYFWQPSKKQIQQPEFIQQALEIISRTIPVSVNIADNKVVETGSVDTTSICWRVADRGEPEPQGRFLVVLCQENDLKRIRQVIEQLQDWMGEHRQAALIFEGDNALVQAQQARMIAEMLVI